LTLGGREQSGTHQSNWVRVPSGEGIDGRRDARCGVLGRLGLHQRHAIMKKAVPSAPRQMSRPGSPAALLRSRIWRIPILSGAIEAGSGTESASKARAVLLGRCTVSGTEPLDRVMVEGAERGGRNRRGLQPAHTVVDDALVPADRLGSVDSAAGRDGWQERLSPGRLSWRMAWREGLRPGPASDCGDSAWSTSSSRSGSAKRALVRPAITPVGGGPGSPAFGLIDLLSTKPDAWLKQVLHGDPGGASTAAEGDATVGSATGGRPTRS